MAVHHINVWGIFKHKAQFVLNWEDQARQRDQIHREEEEKEVM